MLYSLIERNAAKYPHKCALQIKRENAYQQYTHLQVSEYAVNFAKRLRAMNCGTHIALWGESTPEWVIAYCGIHLAGAIVVPLDPQLSADAVANLLRYCDIKTIVCSVDLQTKAQNVGEQIDLEIFTLQPAPQCENSLLYPCDSSCNFEPHLADKHDVISIIFTSGTTGNPKGVMLTYENFEANVRGILHEFKGSENDVSLCILPLYHCYSFTTNVMLCFYLGATITFQPILQGPLILQAIQETGVTFMPGVPQVFAAFDRVIFEKIASQPLVKRMMFRVFYGVCHFARVYFRINLGRLFFKQIHQRFGANFRFFISGGAKLETQIATHFWNLGIPLAQGYGLTETAPVITVTECDRLRPGSVGRAIQDVEVRIESPDANGVGEVVARGPIIMKGYFKNPTATAETIRDGWLFTGDLGYMDDQGFVYITGRKKEVIVLSSGKNIYPDEVEKEFLAAPGIADVCVMSPKKAQNLRALIIPDFEDIKKRKVPSVHSEIKFRVEKVNRQLPSYARVTSFDIVTGPFPRTSLGKLKRVAINSGEWQSCISSEEKIPISAEDLELLEKDSSKKLIACIQRLLEYEEEVLPAHSIELDLGMSSIKYMELLTILQQQFSVNFPSGATPVYTHVRDILQSLPESCGEQINSDFHWQEFFAKPPSASVESSIHMRRGFVARMMLNIMRCCCRILLYPFFRASVRGFDKINSGPIILAPNHQSYLDPIILLNAMPMRVFDRSVFVAMDAIFGKWPFRLFAKQLRIIRTASSATTLLAMQHSAQVLHKEMILCMFPEGLRSSDGSVRTPQLGMGILACECQATIYPVRIEGGMNTFSRLNPGFRFCRIKHTVLDPIVPPQKDHYSEEDYREVVMKWHASIQQELL